MFCGLCPSFSQKKHNTLRMMVAMLFLVVIGKVCLGVSSPKGGQDDKEDEKKKMSKNVALFVCCARDKNKKKNGEKRCRPWRSLEIETKDAWIDGDEG